MLGFSKGTVTTGATLLLWARALPWGGWAAEPRLIHVADPKEIIMFSRGAHWMNWGCTKDFLGCKVAAVPTEPNDGKKLSKQKEESVNRKGV